MKILRLFEYQKFYFSELEKLGPRLKDDIRSFDEKHAKSNGGSLIFNWNHKDYFKATHYVGVVQVGNLCIEILPKIDNSAIEEQRQFIQSRENLIYMLSMTQNLPLLQRDEASQSFKEENFLEFIIRSYLVNLDKQIRLGIDRKYIYRESNLKTVKGKLLLTKHLVTNGLTSLNAFVGFDEFSEDTTINRILKAGCDFILKFSASSENKLLAKRCVSAFDEVDSAKLGEMDYVKIVYSRNNTRYSILVDFAWALISKRILNPKAGDNNTFAFVFSMHRLFEEFMANLIKKNAGYFGLSAGQIAAQAAGNRRWFMTDKVDPSGRFRLKPDILILSNDGNPLIVLDTKWKKLLADDEDVKNGVSQGDLYQLFAYAKIFKTSKNILLYPAVNGTSESSYLPNDGSFDSIEVRFIDLNRNLKKEKRIIIEELRLILEI
ncbi:MAG: hypothetical protein H7235_07240 [Bdellovibrionaceae bacterium]|nr:hypothetical protein [Pseudobdellovibrionaceae bacterium]